MNIFGKKQAAPDSGPIYNLDEIIESDLKFTLLGVKRKIRPLDLDTYLKIAASFHRQSVILSKDKIDRQELADFYFELFSSCVEPFKREDIFEMNHAQIGGLYTLIINKIQGRKFDPEAIVKKKVS